MQACARTATRGRRLIAIAVALAAVTAGVGAPTAAMADADVSVHGVVTAAGKPLSGVPVGFWARSGHGVASTTTSTTGTFTLHVPSDVAGFAYAGTQPGSTAALFTSGGTRYVRGVIGEAQAAGTSYPLYQGHRSAVPARLHGGLPLHFRLEQAGRLSVDATHLSGIIVKNLAGGSVTGGVEENGRYLTSWLVPGRYRVDPVGTVPWLGPARPATVLAGRTTAVPVTMKEAATLTGRLTFPDGDPVTEQVPVDLLEHGVQIATTTSTASGTYSIPLALAPGSYSLRIGVNPPFDPDYDYNEPPDIRPTAATIVPARDVPLTVSDGDLRPTKDVTLAAAGSVTGTVAFPSEVWLEQSDGTMIARSFPGRGTFDFGGLVPGETYRVVARSSETGKWGQSSALTATSSTMDVGTIELANSGLKVSGAVAGATHGTVHVVDPTGYFFGAGSAVRSTSKFAASVIPGKYRVYATVGAAQTASTTVHITADTVMNLGRASVIVASLKVRFVSGSALAHPVVGRLRGPHGSLLDIHQAANQQQDVVRLTGLPAGTYVATDVNDSTYLGDSWHVPASHAPWWFAVPSLRVTLRAGESKDLGSVALHVRTG